MKIKKILKKLQIKKWIKDGMIVGSNFRMERDSYIDSSFPWMIEIGNNVTIAPEVLILSHDGSTKNCIGYSKIGKVVIGNNVFIGAKTIILPNTYIGDNCVIGANSVVQGTYEPDTVIVGNPAKKISTVEKFKEKHNNKMKNGIKLDVTYTKKGNISKIKKSEMKDKSNDFDLYIV